MLQFHLDNAEKIHQLEHLQKLAKTGVDIPFVHAWNTRPKPKQASAWAWRAWEILNSRRLIFESTPQPIQLSEIATYANEAGITSQPLREDLLYAIITLDLIWREHAAKKRHERMQAERRKQEQTAKTANKGRIPPRRR